MHTFFYIAVISFSFAGVGCVNENSRNASVVEETHEDSIRNFTLPVKKTVLDSNTMKNYIGSKAFKKSGPGFGFNMYTFWWKDSAQYRNGGWGFASHNDSLDQYSFGIGACEYSQECFNRYYRFIDSAITVFTTRFGDPVKFLRDSTKFYKSGPLPRSGGILKAMWIINGDKIKADFSFNNEHDLPEYRASIERFRDHHGNIPVILTPWYDGF